MDLGGRYDFEPLPAVFRQDANNFSPRIGLAYHAAPFWVLRAGYGIFFDRYVLASLNPALQKNGINAFEQVLAGSAAAAVFQSAGGGALPAAVGGGAAALVFPRSKVCAPHIQAR